MRLFREASGVRARESRRSRPTHPVPADRFPRGETGSAPGRRVRSTAKTIPFLQKRSSSCFFPNRKTERSRTLFDRKCALPGRTLRNGLVTGDDEDGDGNDDDDDDDDDADE